MRQIKTLPQEVISQIAAGEVIERPAYAVKELIENSIDAGADTITIHIEDSGLKKIMVIDNGIGMSKEDILLSFQPHTTSKLATIDDLTRIHTHGFRGEALASIAAISKLTINSRAKNEPTGTSVTVQDGFVKEIPIGMPVGTEVIVQNLFSPVPGRKKFLKSKATEYRHTLEFITFFAVAHPNIKFLFTNNKKTIFDLPKTTDPLQRIQLLFGYDLLKNLLPVQYEDAYIKISGYIAKPQLTSKSLRKQYIYINNRKVFERGLLHAIKAGYGTLIEKTVYPVFFLYYTTPYDMVDVNVHPRKEEVRFFNKQLVLDATERIVIQTLAENNLVFHDSLWQEKKITQSYAGNVLRDEPLSWNLTINSKQHEIVQLHNVYIMTEVASGILMIDQHAAHERILYEQYAEIYEEKKLNQEMYTLPDPLTITVSYAEAEVLKEFHTLLKDFGFTFEHYKNNTFLLLEVPLLFKDRNHQELIKELLEDLEDEKKLSIDSLTKKMIAYMACKGAVKSGDALTRIQMEEIIEKLEKTKNNATCPHGRPTKIYIEKKTIDKMFKR